MTDPQRTCPVARVAAIIGDYCTVLLVRDLVSGPKRFKDLQASLCDTSSRTLTKKLKVLLAEGMVARTEFKEKPPRVQYSLTKKGRQLEKITRAMRIYGEKYMVTK
jgi:DNA-binding HxlR family transcriptional regulator